MGKRRGDGVHQFSVKRGIRTVVSDNWNNEEEPFSARAENKTNEAEIRFIWLE